MKERNVIRTMIEIALFAAIGFVLDELQGSLAISFPNGGSIGFAMVAVLIIAYRRGCLPAVLTGLIIGLFDMATKAYVLHPLQVLFDYILPYAVVGLAGLFKPLCDKAQTKGKKILWLVIGSVVGGLLKLVSHFIAGVVWWGDPEYFAWGLNNWNVYLYSFVYNLAFIGPSIVLSGSLLVILYLKAPVIFTVKGVTMTEASNKKINVPVLVTSIVAIIGAFLGIFFLIKYINSFKWKASSSKYSFDQDSMVILLTGFVLLLFSINSFLMIVKKRFRYLNLFTPVSALLGIHIAYSLSHIIDMYINKEPVYYYWIWLGCAVALLPLFIILIIKEKKNSSSSQN